MEMIIIAKSSPTKKDLEMICLFQSVDAMARKSGVPELIVALDRLSLIRGVEKRDALNSEMLKIIAIFEQKVE